MRHQPKTDYFVYDIKDDATLFKGTYADCVKVLDTMAGNLVIAPQWRIDQYREHYKN